MPVLVTALLSGFSSDALAAGVFILASFTDALDGWLARRHKSESNFGKPSPACARWRSSRGT